MRVAVALRLALALGCMPIAATQAETAPSPDAKLAKSCAEVPATPTQAHEFALRAQCVLSGTVPSADKFQEGRALARQALALGDPAGGILLYLAFNGDPANRYLRDGKPDMQAYARLAERPLDQRAGQIEAIEALAQATSKGSMNAGILLAGYFNETVAPGNVTRERALASVLMRNGQRPPLLVRLEHDAAEIEKAAPATHASVQTFADAYRSAAAVAVAAYKSQTGGKSCEQPTLKSVSAGEIVGAEYLPLKGTMVQDSFLVKGAWPEYWTFAACGEPVPVIVKFQADGWGGANFSATYNKGE